MQTQSFPINFAMGLDTKTDPKQIQVGKFLQLQNMIFQKGKLLQKRNGYGPLTSIKPAQSYITTLNDNLTSVGQTVSAYSPSLNKWITKGTLQPCALSVLPLIRNNVTQTQCDTAIANGMVLTTYTQTYNTSSGVINQYLYAIADSNTGQNIVEPTPIPSLAGGVISGSSRAFVVGNYFVIVSPTFNASTKLQYISIPLMNPVNSNNTPNVSMPQTVTTENYNPITSNPGWDAIVANNELVVAYNSTTGGQGIHAASLTQQQIALNFSSTTIIQFTNAAYVGAIVSVCVDTTNATMPIFYISFWNNSTTNGYTCAVYTGFGSIIQQFAPQQIITTTAIANLASAAQNNICTVFSEVVNAYGYDSAIPTNFINDITVTSAGSVGTTILVARSVGLASKAFIVNNTFYFLAAYQSTYQPSYFLINGSLSTGAAPIIVSALANLNGNGYSTLGLPSVNVSSNVANISYLYKDSVQALNTVNNTAMTSAGGIYSQEGVNLVNFTIGTMNIDTTEIARNLFISGGYLAQYDAYLPVENNFFIWPDNVECTYTATSTVTPTGTASSGSNTITLSSATGVSVGMTIADTTNPTYIPANTTITFLNGLVATISNVTTNALAADSLSIQGNIAAVPTGGVMGAQNYAYIATYEWTDNQGLPYRSQPSIPVFVTTSGTGTSGSITINVPTLRLTSKTANPVKIVIYRWSVNTQVYNQVTSIFAPILNSTTIDSVSFVDNLPDSKVVGNNILYTTGGVVPDTCTPSTSIMTLFDTRLWLVDAEDPHQLWLSKTVVEGAPVEMSNQFTIYVSPTAGTVGSLGPITGLFPMDDKLIIFFKEGIYYLNGTGPTPTGATANGSPIGNYSQPIFVTSVVGCTNQQSIVLTADGLMFQSDKGIWLLGRDLSTKYIGAEVEAFNGFTVNSANLIPETNFILFTLTGTNTMLMYDYFYAQWGTFVGPYAVSSCIYNGLHTLIDKYGNISQETPGLYLDGSNPVLMNLVTGNISFEGISGYQALVELQLLGSYITPHFLNTVLGYNFGPLSDQVEIQPTNSTGVYGSDALYGQTTPYGGPGDLEQWRIQPSTAKCQSFQISITEVYDASLGIPAGAGFTLSAMTCTLGLLRGYRPVKATNTIGTASRQG